MAVVHRLLPESPEIERVVTQLLRNAFYSYADLFATAGSDPRAIRRTLPIDPAVHRLLDECRASGRGLLLVGAHMCSFDMLLLRLPDIFPTVQILSKADPIEGNCLMNELRRAHGLTVTPIGIVSLRQAVTTLRSGGVVAIAADLPGENGTDVLFFGRRTRLLAGHARLALLSGAQMMVGASVRVGRNAYRVEMTPVPQPPPTGDRQRDAVLWEQASVTALELLIEQAPEQWFMPQPVWAGPAAEGVFA
jgi:lauroyl/myristoyl acyltransferase